MPDTLTPVTGTTRIPPPPEEPSGSVPVQRISARAPTIVAMVAAAAVAGGIVVRVQAHTTDDKIHPPVNTERGGLVRAQDIQDVLHALEKRDEQWRALLRKTQLVCISRTAQGCDGWRLDVPEREER